MTLVRLLFGRSALRVIDDESTRALVREYLEQQAVGLRVRDDVDARHAAREARSIAATFGSMPPESLPSSRKRRSPARSRYEISERGSSSDSRMPGAPVAMTNFSALSSQAIMAATVSALMLSTVPWSSAESGLTIGTRSLSSCFKRMLVSSPRCRRRTRSRRFGRRLARAGAARP